jgi:hypothetical protein
MCVKLGQVRNPPTPLNEWCGRPGCARNLGFMGCLPVGFDTWKNLHDFD